ncbi:MAG: OmpH family outer membrane protein [Flavisolibacter sp.]|jgi:outer membrane protein|nr:OmpH family outer membrane protein [Flavisolibacter sp.]
MKNASLIFNIVLLALVGVLFYLHFSSGKKVASSTEKKSQVTASAEENGEFKIAYFELDSITNSFSMVKDVKSELNKEEEKMSSEMAGWQKRYNDKITRYQNQAQTQPMSQVESEKANTDLLQMQETIRNKKQELDQRFQNMYMQKMKEVTTKIEAFLQDYNQDKRYSYILAYEPGFIYYRDTMYNITKDLIKGLNDQYTTKKK